MASPAPAIDAELEAVTAALAAVDPRTKRLLLFGSRGRGDARPDSDFDVLVVMPQATLTPPAAAVEGGRGSGGGGSGGCRAPRGLPLAWGGAALREGRELHVAG
jgi:hypothetical protein